MIRLTKAQANRMGLKVKTLSGDPVQYIWLRLPWPPSSNTLYPTVGNRRILSEAGKAYKAEVAKACEGKGHVVGRVTLEVWVYPPDLRRRDISNTVKILEDSFTACGVWEDDFQVDHLIVHRCEVRPAQNSPLPPRFFPVTAKSVIR